MQLRTQFAILAAVVPTLTDSALCSPGLHVSFSRATPSHADARLYWALWSWSCHPRRRTPSTPSPMLVFQQTCWKCFLSHHAGDFWKLNSMGFSIDLWVTSCMTGYSQSRRHWSPLSEHDPNQFYVFCQNAQVTESQETTRASRRKARGLHLSRHSSPFRCNG